MDTLTIKGIASIQCLQCTEPIAIMTHPFLNMCYDHNDPVSHSTEQKSHPTINCAMDFNFMTNQIYY